MTNDKNNGKKDASELLKTRIEEKEKVKELKTGDVKNAFFSKGDSNIANNLIVPGEDPLAMSMRSYYGKQNDGVILAVAFAAEWADLEEFEYEPGKQGLLMNMAGRRSVLGLACEQLVDAIIGDKQMKARTGFFDKFKGLYGSPDKGGKE
jgi:hypothetical protein